MQHTTNGQVTQPARSGRYLKLPGFVRSVSPAAVAVTVSLLIGGAGFADAATGGNFLLGKANKETSTASLSDSRGTPLALSAPAGKAPLAVNRTVLVKNLNAQYLGGLTATGLAVTGGEGFTAPGTNAPISMTGADDDVASTGKLPAGTYYVTATATLQVANGDMGGNCAIIKGSAPTIPINIGVAPVGTYSVAESAAVTVTAGDTLIERCVTFGNNGSAAYDAGILAIQVLSSSHQ
jgi:hypothetical protein